MLPFLNNRKNETVVIAGGPSPDEKLEEIVAKHASQIAHAIMCRMAEGGEVKGSTSILGSLREKLLGRLRPGMKDHGMQNTEDSYSGYGKKKQATDLTEDPHYAMGGEVEYGEDDDFLTADMPAPMVEEPHDDENERKRMLSGILGRVRMSHMGR